MRQFFGWTAAVLLAVIVFFGAYTSGTFGASEEDEEVSVSGSVSHTERWEENRQNANRWFLDRGESEHLHSADVFWSGEKFVLHASVSGDQLPPYVLVRIEGTDYRTRLYEKDGRFEGSLFDRDMLFRWGQNKPEVLHFVFEAEVSGQKCQDRQSITVDDRQPYWLLHRKE